MLNGAEATSPCKMYTRWYIYIYKEKRTRGTITPIIDGEICRTRDYQVRGHAAKSRARVTPHRHKPWYTVGDNWKRWRGTVEVEAAQSRWTGG